MSKQVYNKFNVVNITKLGSRSRELVFNRNKLKFLGFICLLFLVSCMDSEIDIRFNESGGSGPLSMSYFAESAPDGSGVSFEDLELEINETKTLYAIKRDSAGNYVENTAVYWAKEGSI